MEIWSLTRFPEGEPEPRPEPGSATTPLAADPGQDFSNLPRQRASTRGFEYMRLSERPRGDLNFERTSTASSPASSEKLLRAAAVNVNPLESPSSTSTLSSGPVRRSPMRSR